MGAKGVVLRVELSEDPMTPLRVRVQREGDGTDYGWVRLDELTHLVAALAPSSGTDPDPSGQ